MKNKNHDTLKTYRQNTSDLILRDLLALDRTILANERTLLAWVRTALSLLVAGVGFMKFIDIKIISTLGIILIPVGIITLIIGICKFTRLRKLLLLLRLKKQ